MAYSKLIRWYNWDSLTSDSLYLFLNQCRHGHVRKTGCVWRAHSIHKCEYKQQYTSIKDLLQLLYDNIDKRASDNWVTLQNEKEQQHSDTGRTQVGIEPATFLLWGNRLVFCWKCSISTCTWCQELCNTFHYYMCWGKKSIPTWMDGWMDRFVKLPIKQWAKDYDIFPSQRERQNTRQNSNLNEDISSPRAYWSKSQAVGQQPNESQQLLLRARQPQLSQEEHRFTTATREQHSIGRQEKKSGRKSGHQIVSFAHLCLSELLTWTQRHWRDSSLRLWLHTQRSPAPPGCWSPAGSDSAWLSLTRWWTTQPAGMERAVMTQT